MEDNLSIRPKNSNVTVWIGIVDISVSALVKIAVAVAIGVSWGVCGIVIATKMFG